MTMTTASGPPGGQGVEGGRYFNRDLSWLEFNRRVLDMAMDDRVPLLERVKFLAIFSSNLDEFFMKRVGLLKRRVAEGNASSRTRPDELSPRETLTRARAVVSELANAQGRCWEEALRPALVEAGIAVVSYASLGEAEREPLEAWYRANAYPVLTPLAVDPGHRFPFISNLSENLGVMLRRREDRARVLEPLFARVKLPDVLPQLINVDDPGAPLAGSGAGATRERPLRLVALDDLVASNLGELFPGLDIEAVMPFRVTRSAVVEADDDDGEDLLEQVEAQLRARRFSEAVRIQVFPDADPRILRFVTDELKLTGEDVFADGGLLDETDLFELVSLDREDLLDPPWRPRVPPSLANPDMDIFSCIRAGVTLVHHPYESFEHSVERFIAEAADDPDVLAIKQTLYRTSKGSPFVDSLTRAAADGKQVACLVELRARFDEEKNVAFARKLEKAGVHVAYGVVGLKTHCKISLVVRREVENGEPIIRAYAHVGTGNYHPGTAQLYTDLGVLTCNPVVTADVAKLFNALTGHAAEQSYDRLVVAPTHLRGRFEELIDNEIRLAKAGRPGRIIAKMNSLEDRQLTERLYEASRAGVRVTCLVRGFCCLRPGVPGLSEHIDVISVMGRFLEHSRVFFFGAGAEDPLDGTYLIGSADWMHRNLNDRVEAALTVVDRGARASLWRMLDVMQRDRRNAWVLGPDGVYEMLVPRDDDAADSPEAMGTFATLMADADEYDPA